MQPTDNIPPKHDYSALRPARRPQPGVTFFATRTDAVIKVALFLDTAFVDCNGGDAVRAETKALNIMATADEVSVGLVLLCHQGGGGRGASHHTESRLLYPLPMVLASSMCEHTRETNTHRENINNTVLELASHGEGLNHGLP